ncbi:MAG: alpha-2-macroglobulin family protein [Gemmataceae bacterium]
MRGCPDYQDWLLDHLYDLLDEAEQQALQDHLSGCAACSQALERAEAQKQMLARAARLQFPEATFVAPLETASASLPVTVLPGQVPFAPQRTWFPLALAASLLVALLTGLALPTYRTVQQYRDAQAVIAQHDKLVADARARVEASNNQLRQAAVERNDQISTIEKEIKARELRLVVTGPRNVQPGAPADYLVRAVDLNGKPADADIVARLAPARLPPRPTTPMAMAQSGPDSKTLSSPNDKKSDGTSMNGSPDGSDLTVTRVEEGTYKVRIPPTLRLQPGQELGMLVASRKPLAKGALRDAEKHSKSKAESKLEREQVRLTGQVQLRAPVFLTHLTTDKPIYQPGETVRFRSLTIDRATLAPPPEDFRLLFTLTNPTGMVRQVAHGASLLAQEKAQGQQVVVGPDGKPVRGIGTGEIALEAELPGGEYTLTVTEEAGRFPPVTRKFLVNRYQKPRLDKKLDFNRSTYGPGDEVQARVSALRADGGPVRDRPVEITVAIDDRLYDAQGKESGASFPAKTDDTGTVLTRFRLPTAIERGQASLSVKFDDGGAVETITRTIPLVLKKLEVEFFPEGGDLVAGLQNRVYFQARSPLGKPAQMRGVLLEDGQPMDVTLETLHDDARPGANQGQGVFGFTPKAGKKYEVRVDSPTGIADRKALPVVKADGVVLSVPGGVFQPGDPLKVQVHSSRPRHLLIGAYCRGVLLDTVELRPGSTEAVLRPASGVGGVCRITVFELAGPGQFNQQPRPVAERLVYRHPRERLDISIAPDRRTYVPGQKANLRIVTTNEAEKPTAALAMVAVVDQSVLTMADEKTYRTQPTHFLLTTEVRRADELEYADFLVSMQPKAAVALDLLLGTQGWRRFAEQNPTDFRERLRREADRLTEVEKQRREEDGERLLVLAGQSAPQSTDFDQEKMTQVQEEYAEKVEQLQEQHAEAAEELAAAGQDEGYRAALTQLSQVEQRLARLREVGSPILTGLALVFGLVALLAVLARRMPAAGTCLGLASLAALLMIGSWNLPTARPTARETAQVDLAKVAPAAMVDELAPRWNDADGGLAGGEGKPGMQFGLGNLGGGGGVGGPMPAPPAPMAAAMGPLGAPGGGPPGMALEGMARRAGNPKDVDRFARRLGEDPRDVNGIQVLGEDRAKGGQALRMRRALLRDERKQMRDLEELRKDAAPRLLAADGRGAFAKRMAKDADMLEPLIFREYAHVRSTQTEPGLRSDFTETLYWHPVLLLPDGQGSVSFDLCDSVTSFQVAVQAHTLDGRLGSATRLIESRLPFTLAPKVPVEVTASDRVDVALALSNNTPDARQVDLRLAEHKGFDLVSGQAAERLEVAGEGRARRIFGLKPTLQQGTATVVFEGRTAPFGVDAIRETVRVVPDGFPVSGSSSDLLEKSATHRFTLPRWLPGTLGVRVEVYPSTLADLQKGLEGLLREPNGCFEQTSTSNYPNVLVLDYLRSTNKANPEVEKRTRELLDRGYQKLVSFECQDTAAKSRRGYEWFGGTAPPHEALTAYGLLQFRDMARVHEVDTAMLTRTSTYLLGQRDGKGGFRRNDRALDTFGRAPDAITNAYIVWALTESGSEDVKLELDALASQAQKSDDPYFLSLVALGLGNRGRAAEASALLKKIAERQQPDGQLAGAKTSITGSGGRDLAIETSALALLAWLKNDAFTFDKQVRLAVRWIGQQRGESGTFGSTQSTILALKALIAWTRANQRTVEGGELTLFVGDKKVGELRFPAGAEGTLVLPVPDPEKLLQPGDNQVRVAITGAKNIFPHTLAWTCRTATPVSAKELKVKLTANLAQTKLSEGDPTRLRVRVENVSGAPQGMAVAVVGLPAGLIVPEDLKQLKELCKLPEGGKRPTLGAFEIQGRDLILYWRDLGKDEVIDVGIDLIARVPGQYRGPASRAYLYYNADHRHWIDPLTVEIAAK